MRRIVTILSAGLVLVLSACSPPAMLNALDGASGSGRGVERAAGAVAFGDQGQALDVWRPEGAAADTAKPVVVFFYGGGWVKGKRQEYGFAARAYAANGFVVVVPDYRKVPTVRFPAFVEDAAQAVKWTRDNIARYGGDPSRIALAGHSAGGYAVAMLALDKRWLTAEGVDPGVVKAGVGLCGPYDFYPFTRKRSIDAMKGVAEPLLTQPIRFARADAPPLLLVTATEDVTVRPRNAINLTAALQQAGAPVTLKSYRGLDHEDVVMALAKPFRDKAPVLADSVAFLNDALGKESRVALKPER